MSVYIKDMEMPKSCSLCKLFSEYGCPFIGAVGYALTRGERNEDCPLVPVPEHGRLGDLDELLDRAFGCLDEETFLAFQFLVNGSVIIIPASKEELSI